MQDGVLAPTALYLMPERYFAHIRIPFLLNTFYKPRTNICCIPQSYFVMAADLRLTLRAC